MKNTYFRWLLLALFSSTCYISYGQWQQLGQNLSSSYSYMGHSTDFSADGLTIVVGEAGESDDLGTYFVDGRLAVYEYNNGSWVQKGTHIYGESQILGNTSGDEFGYAVAANADGSIVAGGAFLRNNRRGQARVFRFDDTTNDWIQMGQSLVGNSLSEFGRFIELSDDGMTMAVSAPRDNSYIGRVEVYRFNTTNTTWELLGNVITGNTNYYHCGHSIHLGADGNSLAVVTSDFDTSDKGKVEVFNYNSTTNHWDLKGQSFPILTHSDNDYFYVGTDVSLSNDGNILAYSEQNDYSYGTPGITRIFSFDYTTSQWQQMGADLVGEHKEASGHTIELSADGQSIVIGAPYYQYSGLTGTGRARVFKYDGVNWNQFGTHLVGKANGAGPSGFTVGMNDAGTIVSIGSFRGNEVQIFGDANALAPKPDFSARIIANPTIVSGNNSVVNFLIKIKELNDVDASNINITITDTNLIAINFDNTLTQLSGNSVDNGNWEYLGSTNNLHSFRLSNITASGTSCLGIKSNVNYGGLENYKIPVGLSIVPNSAGDENIVNDMDVEVIVIDN